VAAVVAALVVAAAAAPVAAVVVAAAAAPVAAGKTKTVFLCAPSILIA
jgi:hypothetical protein